MKIKVLFMFFAVVFLTSTAFSQTLVVTPKKTVYTRKGAQVPSEKRTFNVTYPVVSGQLPAPARKKLEDTISYWRVFETTLADNMTEHWLSDLFYKVNYNRDGILDIALTQEGVGAYPSSQTVNLVVDTKTGEQVKFDDAFKSETRAAFAALVDQKLDAEKKGLVKEVEAGKFSDGAADKEADAALKEQLEGLEFTADTFDQFSVSDKGVTIFYDAGFPHVIQAAEPSGRYFFTWAEARKFVRADGPLGRFVK